MIGSEINMKQDGGPDRAWNRFERLLLIGTEGSVLASADRLFELEEFRSTIEVVQSDGVRAVGAIVNSASGLCAPRTALSRALAMAACFGDDPTRIAAFDALPRVCPGARELFRFVDACKGLRGWGRGVREAVAQWYVDQPVEQLEASITKCPRYGEWAHRDLVRLSHPVPTSSRQSGVFRRIVDGGYDEIVVEDTLPPTADSIKGDTSRAFRGFSCRLRVAMNPSASMAATSIPSNRQVPCEAAARSVADGLGESVPNLETLTDLEGPVDLFLTDFDQPGTDVRVVWALAESVTDLATDGDRASVVARGFEPEFPGLIARFLGA